MQSEFKCKNNSRLLIENFVHFSDCNAREREKKEQSREEQSKKVSLYCECVQPLGLLGHISLLAHFFFLFVRFFFLPFFLLFHFTLLPIASYCVSCSLCCAVLCSLLTYAFFLYLRHILSLFLSLSPFPLLIHLSTWRITIAAQQWLIRFYKLHLAFVWCDESCWYANKHVVSRLQRNGKILFFILSLQFVQLNNCILTKPNRMAIE